MIISSAAEIKKTLQEKLVLLAKPFCKDKGGEMEEEMRGGASKRGTKWLRGEKVTNGNLQRIHPFNSPSFKKTSKEK